MQKRITYLDTLKGIGIILMIMGHLGFGEMFSKYIHAFNMPLFFIISGYFFDRSKYRNFQQFLLRKAKTLLIPYFVFGILHVFIAIMTINDFDVGKSLRALFFYNNSGLAITGALWFLTSLFFAEIIFYILEKYLRGISLFIACMLIAVFACTINIILPYSGRAAMVAVGFVYVGYCLKIFNEKQIIKKILSLNWIMLGIFLLINAGMILVTNSINMRRGIYGVVPLFWVNAIVATILYWNLCKKIETFNGLIFDFVSKFVKYVGNYSVIYLCLNEVTIKCIQKIVDSSMSDNFLIKLLIKVGNMILILLILTLINKMVERLKVEMCKKRTT